MSFGSQGQAAAIDRILSTLLPLPVYQRLDRSQLAAGTLQVSLQQLVKQYDDSLQDTVKAKLQLLGNLVGRLQAPLDVAEEVVLHSECQNLQDVVSQFWEQWHGDLKKRNFAISIFEAEPTRTVAALVSSGHFKISPTLQADCVATLNALAPTINLLKDPMPPDHAALADLDDSEDESRKQAVLRFILSIQQLCLVVTEPMQLPILICLGFTTTEQIAFAPLQSLQAMLASHDVSSSHVQRIHHQASDVLARSEASWLTMIQGSQDTSAPRVLQPWPATIKADGPPENIPPGSTRASNNLSSWFGDLDEVGCKDCCSVTSPAAYFVDLLRMLKNQDAKLPEMPVSGVVSSKTMKKPDSLLDKLFERRPDLGDLLLSCRNTSDVVPYIDLVNEALESAVAYLHDREKVGEEGLELQVHNADDSGIQAHQDSHLPQEAVNVRYDVYDDFISKKVYPSTLFPYDHSKDSLCRYIQATGSTESEVLETFRTNLGLQSKPEFKQLFENKRALDSVYARAHSAQVLGLSHADFLALTLESYYDLYSACLHQNDDSLTKEEYEKLAGLLPSWYYWGYEDKKPENGDGEDTMLDTKKGDGLAFIKRQVLPRLGTKFSTLVEILRTRFMDDSLVISLLPAGTVFDTRFDVPTQLDGFRLRGRGGRSLDVSSLQRLDQFVRLWRRLGWSIEDVDDALCAFATSTPTIGDESKQSALKITPDTIEKLAAVVELSKLTEIEPKRIIALFSPFARHLLTMPVVQALVAIDSTAAKSDSKSSADGNSGVGLIQFLPLLLSSLNISYGDFVQIQANEQLGATLTLRAVFTYNRMAEAAKIFKIPSAQLPSLLAVLSQHEAPLSGPTTCLKALVKWKPLQSDGWEVPSLIAIAKGLNSGVTESALNDNMIKFTSTLLSSILNDKECLLSTKNPSLSQSAPNKPNALPSAPSAIADQPIHSVIRGLFKNIPQDLIPTLLHTCQAVDGPFYDSVIRLTEGLSIDDLQGGFKGRLFFSANTTIKIEGRITDEKANLRFEDKTIELRRLPRDQKSDKILLTLEAAQDSLIYLSLPQVLSEIKISFFQADGTASKSFPHVVSEDILLSAQYVADQLWYLDLVLARYSFDFKELEAIVPTFLTSTSGLETLLSIKNYISARKSLARPKEHAAFALLVKGLRDATTQLTSSDLVNRFTQATSLNNTTMEELFSGNNLEAAFVKAGIKVDVIGILSIMGNQVKLLAQLGLKEDSIKLLFQIAQPPSFGAEVVKVERQSRPLTQFVQLLRASLINRGLKQSIEKAQDELRDNRRKALIQYLLQNPALKAKDVFDEESLFEFFLIDVQMGCGLETTRIKQAISTVQLFVHRCLLGLEDGIESSLISRERWAWMQKYTLWEANRKVFLYPENWVDPTLRDSKTELFRSIEDAVMQTNLDDKAVCKIIRSYIYQADEIANLQIDAYYWDKAPEPVRADGTKNVSGQGTFHFVARTRNAPYQFWYRRLEYFARGSLPSTTWTAWEILPLEAKSYEADYSGKSFKRSGAYLVPVVWRKRLIVFFPQLTVVADKTKKDASLGISLVSLSTDKKTQQMSLQAPTTSPVKLNMEVKMAWSERIDGIWTSQKQSQDNILVQSDSDKPPAFESFRFNTEFTDESVSVVVYRDTGLSEGHAVNTCLGQFTLRGPRVSYKSTLDMKSKPKFPNLNVPKTNFGTFERLRNNEMSLGNLAGQPSNSTVEKAAWPSLSKPPLEKTRDYSSVTWTLDSGASHSRPLGLVADVNVSDGVGSESWFTIPKNLAVEGGSTEPDGFYSMPLYNSLSQSLRYALALEDGVEEIYKVMDRSSIKVSAKDGDSEQGFNYSFGRFGFLAQCKEDATPSAIYNWETGFHLISLLMERLLSLQQFDMALKYARLVFDPTGTNAPKVSTEGQPSPPWRPTWRFPPFRDSATLKHGTIDSIMTTLEPSSGGEDGMAAAILSWRRDPFKPHTVARGRPLAYMKRFIMKYIEALIAAGDVFFRQNSLETLPLAIQRYVEASHVFGSSPEKLPELGKKRFNSYNDIEQRINDFSNASVDLQLSLPYYVPLSQRGQGTSSASLQGMPLTRYFGVQANPEFMALRNRIDDRLFKIRNSLDVNGNPRKLSLWDPPVNINDLVAAAAAGSKSNMALVLSGFSAVMPRQRFMYLVQKAYELCAELKQTSSALLSALEKKDNEVLQMLRSNHESGMQRILMDMKLQQKVEAEKGLEQLQEVRRAAVHRLKFYADLTGDTVKVPTAKDDFEELEQSIPQPAEKDLRLTRHELAEMEAAQQASQFNDTAANKEWWAAELYYVPMPSINIQPMGCGVSEALPNVGQYFQQQAGTQRANALKASESSQQLARISQWTRQLQDRRLQLNLAGREIKSVDKQIEVQLARILTVAKDIEAQKKQSDNAVEVQDFLRTKFTNSELYAWFEASARSYLYQTYLVTMELARKVELAYQFEQGPDARSKLSTAGYWDQGKSGLNCGEQLWFALKQMELSYMNDSRHDFEITKNVSLRQLAPDALLSLRELGETTFDVPEVLFDLDFPGHYLRRIKSVAVSIHCVVGPHVSVNCTATLLDHRYRFRPTADGQYLEQPGGRDNRFIRQEFQLPITSVAISSAQQDTGVFELNFNGDSYQPFEGAGIISQWKLQLPAKHRQFDYRAISDVVMHLRYTAKNGGQSLSAAATQGVTDTLKKTAEASKQNNLKALIDTRNDCPDAWFPFTRGHPGSTSDSRVLSLSNIKHRLPFFARGANIKIQDVIVYARGPEMSQVKMHISEAPDVTTGSLLEYTEKLGELQTFLPSTDIRRHLPNSLDVLQKTDSQWHLIVKSVDGSVPPAPTDLLVLVEYTID